MNTKVPGLPELGVKPVIVGAATAVAVGVGERIGVGVGVG